MRIGLVTLGVNVPSTRFRFLAMVPHLQAAGIKYAYGPAIHPCTIIGQRLDGEQAAASSVSIVGDNC